MFHRTPSSLKWYAIFAHADGEAVVEVPPEGDTVARFDMAVLLGRVGRRSIRAMWIVDEATGEVLRVHGAVPPVIAAQHSGSLRKKPPAPSLSLEQAVPRRRRPF